MGEPYDDIDRAYDRGYKKALSDMKTINAVAPPILPTVANVDLVRELERRVLLAVPSPTQNPPAKNSRQIADEVGIGQLHVRHILRYLIEREIIMPVIMLHPQRRTVCGKGYVMNDADAPKRKK
jgi:hypothetical protein